MRFSFFMRLAWCLPVLATFAAMAGEKDDAGAPDAPCARMGDVPSVYARCDREIRAAVANADATIREVSRKLRAGALLPPHERIDPDGYLAVKPVSPEMAFHTADYMDAIPYVTGQPVLLPPSVPFKTAGAIVAGHKFFGTFRAGATAMDFVTTNFKAPGPAPFKVYISIPPEQMKVELPKIIPLAKDAGAEAMKFRVMVLAGPDRIIIYFGDFDSAHNFGKKMAEVYRGHPGDEVPLSHQVGDGQAPVYLGVDETGSGKRSWRRRVSETIGAAVTAYRSSGAQVTSRITEVAFIRKYLEDAGIDPRVWLPQEFARRLEK